MEQQYQHKIKELHQQYQQEHQQKMQALKDELSIEINNLRHLYEQQSDTLKQVQHDYSAEAVRFI